MVKINRSKFNVDKDKSKRTHNGIVFDSVLEMKYYRDVLCPAVESGDVVSYELQKPYELQPKFRHDEKSVQSIKYVADFFIVYKDGHEEVIDTKGCPDSVALLKRKLFWYKFPEVDYKWVTWVKKFGGWIEYEEYKRLKREEKKNKVSDI
nr:MAG TPA: Endonuclease [Caudoviricetes sp.]